MTLTTRLLNSQWAYNLHSVNHALLSRREIHSATMDAIIKAMFFGGFCCLIFLALVPIFGISGFFARAIAIMECFCFAIVFGIRTLQPKVVVVVNEKKKQYIPSTGKEKRKTFPKLYVAETGFYVDNDPTQPILGLYAAEFISKK